MFICFEEFAFNPAAKALLRRGRLVHLTPRAVKLLGILLENRPLPVAKAELDRQLWPDAHVGENNLPNVVLEVRRTLLDEGRGRELIKTVHGLGYAFVGDAYDVEALPLDLGMFRVSVGGREIGLTAGENWIGRAGNCRVQVDCSIASRRHACIVLDGREATLKDGGSSNGTFLNTRRLTGPVALHHRDQIRVGSIHLGFRIVCPDAPTDKV